MNVNATLRRVTSAGITAAVAAGLVVTGASTASADPGWTSFTNTVGMYLDTGSSGYAGNATPFIDAPIVLRTDPASPELPLWVGGIGSPFCPCTVHWHNETTGERGKVPANSNLLPSETGAGKISAYVTIDGNVSFTLVRGVAGWTAR